MTEQILSNDPDLDELKASLAQVPVWSNEVQFTISPDDCGCHWSWIFQHPERTPEWGFALNTSFEGETFLELWDALLDCVFEKPTQVLHFFEGCHEMSYLGLELLPDQQIKLWMQQEYWHHDELTETGERKISIQDSMVLCYDRSEWFQLISQAMSAFFKDPDYKPRVRDGEPLHWLSFHATAREWPWGMFPIWYELRDQIQDWQAQWLMVHVMIEGYKNSWLFQKVKDAVEPLIFHYYWSCTLIEMLKKVYARYPRQESEALIPAFEQFESERVQIHDFVETMDMAWRENQFYSHIGDESYYPQYYEEAYRIATAEKHQATLTWWVHHLTYLTRRAIPELYDWERMQGWEENLAKSLPEIEQRLDFKWRQNLIWKACFGENPE